MELRPPALVWINGELVKWEEAKVHVLSHALHYGTGVFEGIRGYYCEDNVMRIFRLRDHLVRLYRSAKILHMDIPYPLEVLERAAVELVRANAFSNDIYIRPIAFRGLGFFGLASQNPVDVAIVALEFGKYLRPEGVRCTISSWRKPPADSFPVYAKATGIYLLYHLASLEASLHGYDEAILLDSEGFVAEGAGENIFIVKNGTVVTPPVYGDVLEGITRDTVIRLARGELGVEVAERRIRREELYTADEAFFTGTAAEVAPIVEVDGRRIGTGEAGPITRALMRLYREVVTGKVERYRGWITEVKVR